MTENNDTHDRTAADANSANANSANASPADEPSTDTPNGQPEGKTNGAHPAPKEQGEEKGEVAVEPAGSETMDELFLSPDDSESEVIEMGESSDAAASPADFADSSAANAAAVEELRALREAHEALEKERDDYKNRMLRVAADMENFRRRANREKDDLRKFGIDKVVLELLPVLDNLERALEHAEKSAEVTTIIDGVRMVHRQFVGALEKHGVQGFDSRGEAFDPQRHEAIQQVETDAHDTGTVMEQYQKGYFLHERLIRPALVAVAKRVEGTETTKEPERELAVGEGSGDDAVDAEAPAASASSDESSESAQTAQSTDPAGPDEESSDETPAG